MVSVLVPVAVEKPYSYASDRPLAPGTIVVVPLGPREVIGCVWPDEPDRVPSAKVREIIGICDTRPLTPELVKFVDWVADYTFAPRGMVLRMVLRSPAALEPEAPLTGVRLTGMEPERMTAARRKVMDAAEGGLAWSKSGLAAAAGVSGGVVNGLIEQGVLETVDIPQKPVVGQPDPDRPPLELTDAQRETAGALAAHVRAGDARPVLLDGVTGSGKTEVYFEAVAETLRLGRQALVLVPEIALTGAFLERFARRFGALPGEWHSEVGIKKRARIWRGVAQGDVPVVVGARSALFLPFADLGLIVVDEEHDGAYKQEDGVHYHARDMAVVRGHLAGFPVILSSATPTVESWVNAEHGRYRHLVLPARFSGAEPPILSSIDMREHPPERGHWLSPVLGQMVRETLEAGEQTLLFLNRRGYAPLTLCRTCGHRLACPNCSTWLVEHRFRGVLACHHCGHEVRRPDACPDCGHEDTLVACGPGVERLQEEIGSDYPEARTLVLSSDMPGGIQRLRAEIAAIAEGQVDIIIGTQLVAKGHNFPGLTLVGVVDADLGLAQGDPRAAERTYQLLTQVTGRAGRRGQPSRGVLQTYAPDHPVIEALVSGDRDRFYAQECAVRQRGALPPFGRLAAVIVSAADRTSAEDHARAMARKAPAHEQVRLLGPAEAPLALVRGRYRFRLLAQAPTSRIMHDWLRQWLDAAPRTRGSVRVAVDVDPQSFL
ncbi:MAG TPA: primosomal protein N' [Afifellaceae bacterium]|nr:primosomal protein N' [Afifellaceae bacterium]